MQDIRSFFTQKKGSNVKRKWPEEEEEDDDFQTTKKKPAKKKSKKGGVIFDSDSDSDVEIVSVSKAKGSSKSNGSVSKKTSPYMSKTPAKKKEIDAASFFGASPVQRSNKKVNNVSSKQKAVKVENPRLEIEDHSDDDFQKTLEMLDKQSVPTKTSFASKLSEKMQTSKVLVPQTPEATPQRRSPRKRVQQAEASPLKTKQTKAVGRSQKTRPEIKKEIIRYSPRKTSARSTPEKSKGDSSTPKKADRRGTPVSSKVSPKSPGDGHNNKGSPPDTAEKKRGGPAYRSYLQREGPRCLGSRELPKGEEACLDGLSFVLTGVLEYFDKGELKTHIESLGGAVRTSVSKKTSYLVIGREPGDSKTQKAQEMKVKMLDEVSLYDLISSRPGKRKANTTKKPSPSKKGSNEKAGRTKQEPNYITPSKIDKGKFSWKPSLANSQLSDSQGSEFNSQESLGRQNSQDHKSSSGQPQASTQMWVDKYKPNNSKQIIGQQGDRSNAKKLTKWLQRWHDNNFGPHKDKARFNRDDGFTFKAALLSGPPGVGKTTTAQIVCKEVGFTYFELNASDARSKKTLQECVSEYLDNTVLGSFFSSKPKTKDQHSKHCLIMDEVDGMSGNEDRGGMQELIQLIKGSRVPVICICNDRSHPKIRSLCNHCFDLRFQRPRLPQIKAAMMSVAFKEGVKIAPALVDNMIMASNQDVRQVLHNMSMWSAGQRSDKMEETTQRDGKEQTVKKDLKMGPWDVLRQVFSSSEEISKMTFNDKVGLFFHDYSIAPLFVQENYPNVIPRKAGGDMKKHLDLLSKTADSIAFGDLVDKQIRSSMKWNLLPLQAVFASVLPGEYMRGHLGGMINFPSWLGKNSSRGKYHRILQELQTHMRMSAATSLQSINQEYLPRMREHLTNPLLSEGSDGVDDVVGVMNDYDLTREDFDNILELTQFSGFREPMKAVPPKVKAAFTRAFNKSSHLNPFSLDWGGKAKAKRGGGFEDAPGVEGDAQETQEEEEEDDEDDKALIAKLKGKTTSKKKEPAGKKGKGPAKGKGRAKGKK
ncbi:replication factor C subunit 1-like isoform X1 [Apostichopus japonicus]|uniref:replication factor C subunit 1-like isoform X1 n=1 Tax=Stichopus japonicus TaxID=307972 RepID=UPI003AB5C2B1